MPVLTIADDSTSLKKKKKKKIRIHTNTIQKVKLRIDDSRIATVSS